MDKIEAKIRNNLYEFYDQIAQISTIFSEKQNHWSVIRNVPDVWPRIIYGIDSQIIEQQPSILFSEKVNTGAYPELLVAGDENIRQIDPFLRQHGFVPFSAWKGMAISNLEFVTPPNLPETVQIARLESPADIEQWLKIVSAELIAPSRLDSSLLESLLASPGIEAFLLKYNGVGVSTILTFSSENSSGLYLIATERSAQRQGFGKLLVHQIISQCAKKPIVLHATQKGEALYSKLGFQPFNQFFLYRYLKSKL
jgi:GNAT superfamily N-acetyltransferase